jgi:hypothetical protein
MKPATLLSRSGAALLAALALSGCGTAVQQSFRESPAPAGAALLPYSGETKVFGTYHMSYDAANLTREGYIQIGASSFRTDGHVTFDEIRGEATAVGADIVLFSKRNPRSGRPVDPVATNNDGSAHALSPYVHISSAETAFGGHYGELSQGGGMQDFNGKVTSSGIPGVSSADMEAINAPDFLYDATFWRKARSG